MTTILINRNQIVISLELQYSHCVRVVSLKGMNDHLYITVTIKLISRILLDILMQML